ncbi:hypothetical protein ACFE04_006312 [Oxalis oulophora]
MINNNNNSVAKSTTTTTVDGIFVPVHLPTTANPPSITANPPSIRTLTSLPTKGDLIIESVTPIRTAIVGERKVQLDDSRKLFQRIWTDEDEIEILNGFLDYTTQRAAPTGGGSHHHHYDTTVFYEQIKSRLRLDFNKNQLVEKLRRLKKKYRTTVSKIQSGKDFSFKGAHDRATFEISRKIWADLTTPNSSRSVAGVSSVAVDDNVLLDDEEANNVITNNINLCNVEIKSEDFGCNKSRQRKRARSNFDSGVDDIKLNLNEAFVANNITSSNENVSANGNGIGSAGVVAAGVIEETLKSCLAPLFKDLLSVYKGRGLGGLTMMNNPMLLSLGMPAMNVDERWRKQQILELEVYSKRLELVQDQIKTSLEELRSMGG